MTRRLKWILSIGGILIAITYAARLWFFPYGVVINSAPGAGQAPTDDTLRARIHLPAGFSIHVYTNRLATPRALRVTSAGDVLVASPAEGKVFLLERDANGDGRADGVRTLVDQLNSPHGVAVHDGWLFAGESNGVARVRFDPATREISGALERIVTGLPTAGHWSKTVGVGPDGWLYVAMGSSCNVCIEEDRRRAAITRYHLDGSSEQVYATGLRNSVGFAWQPQTHALYAVENGRDWLGDDFPPDELNRIVEGGFYGWPIANGDRVPDPDYGKGKEELIAKSIPPVHAFGAHVAALGITFYTGANFPERYRGAAFVSQHGSWNRSRKSGYRIVVLFFAADGSIREEDFATGFEEKEQVLVRPVDVAMGIDGSLFVSDDFTGSVYQVVYRFEG